MITIFLHRILERLRLHRERRATVKALSVLDDHQLDDIGITRYDILRLAAGCAYDGRESPPGRVQARQAGNNATRVPGGRPCERRSPSKPERRQGRLARSAPARY